VWLQEWQSALKARDGDFMQVLRIHATVALPKPLQELYHSPPKAVRCVPRLSCLLAE
jgi:hypothetical protein